MASSSSSSFRKNLRVDVQAACNQVDCSSFLPSIHPSVSVPCINSFVRVCPSVSISFIHSVSVSQSWMDLVVVVIRESAFLVEAEATVDKFVLFRRLNHSAPKEIITVLTSSHLEENRIKSIYLSQRIAQTMPSISTRLSVTN